VISISESSSREYGRLWRYVQIKGSGRAVDRAKKLLHIRLERLEPAGSGAAADAINIDGDEVDEKCTDIDGLDSVQELHSSSSKLVASLQNP
jgi:hypothetical protein